MCVAMSKDNATVNSSISKFILAGDQFALELKTISCITCLKFFFLIFVNDFRLSIRRDSWWCILPSFSKYFERSLCATSSRYFKTYGIWYEARANIVCCIRRSCQSMFETGKKKVAMDISYFLSTRWHFPSFCKIVSSVLCNSCFLLIKVKSFEWPWNLRISRYPVFTWQNFWGVANGKMLILWYK